MIAFFSEDTVFTPHNKHELKLWILKVINMEGHQAGVVNFIFGSRDFLLNLNRTHLGHDYHTDVITFDQSVGDNLLSGDIYIGPDQVKENATYYQQPFNRELKRVMIHGILHLMGYNDKTPEEQAEMRKKEEAYLSL